MKNKYWIISGGYIFDELDKTAHNIAIKRIGECVTANATISFIQGIEGDKIPTYERRKNVVWNKCYINMYNNYFDVTFIFIKRK